MVFEEKMGGQDNFCRCFHGHKKVFLGLFRGESGRKGQRFGNALIIYI